MIEPLCWSGKKARTVTQNAAVWPCWFTPLEFAALGAYVPLTLMVSLAMGVGLANGALTNVPRAVTRQVLACGVLPLVPLFGTLRNPWEDQASLQQAERRCGGERSWPCRDPETNPAANNQTGE